MMKCPSCGGPGWVTCSREKYGAVRRRRKCKKCGYAFTTTEITVDRAKGLMIAAAEIIKDIKKM